MAQVGKAIKGGVIIMGSLFWENEKNCVKGKETEGKARRRWRESNLDVKQTKQLLLPVRYGRFSGKKNRKETYTMVLSRDYLKKLGTGLVVPFKRNFLLNEKTKIKEQIERLAIVEGIQKGSRKVFAKCWGAVTIWINPNSIYLDQIKNYWKNNIIGRNIYGYQRKSYEWSDGTLLDNSFQLQLPISSNLDFLLCTYILPKYEEYPVGVNDCDRIQNMHHGYPTPKMIGEAIVNSTYVTYFSENRVNGIGTFDDEEIFRYISKIY